MCILYFFNFIFCTNVSRKLDQIWYHFKDKSNINMKIVTIWLWVSSWFNHCELSHKQTQHIKTLMRSRIYKNEITQNANMLHWIEKVLAYLSVLVNHSPCRFLFKICWNTLQFNLPTLYQNNISIAMTRENLHSLILFFMHMQNTLTYKNSMWWFYLCFKHQLRADNTSDLI